MELTISPTADGLTIRLEEERLDSASAVLFKDAVREAATAGPAVIVLDMQEVEFLDSSGLGAVVGAMKALAPGTRLELARLQPAVARVFTLTHMDRVFTIHDTLPEPADGLGRTG